MNLHGLRPPGGVIDETGLLDFSRQLIRTPGYTGREQDVAGIIAGKMRSLGFDRVLLDSVGNVIGEIRGERPGPRLLFDGHMDTVAVSARDQWTVDPFAGVIKNGKIYGRGASDMKCALAAMLYGLAPLIQQKNGMYGSVFISGTVCEETLEGIALEKVIEAVDPHYVVIGEASELSLKRGQRGRAEIEAVTTGKAAHSSNPKAGRNAVYDMLKLVEQALRQPVPADSFLGRGILELTGIISRPYPGASVVPHCCRATFDRRLLLGETEESVLAPFYQVMASIKKEDPDFQAEVRIVEASQICYTGTEIQGKRFFPAWVLEEEHYLVAGALAGLRQAGIKAAVTKYGFCTNGSYSAGVAGLPTIGFGPGRENEAHATDENLEIGQLIAAAVGYQAIAGRILLKKGN